MNVLSGLLVKRLNSSRFVWMQWLVVLLMLSLVIGCGETELLSPASNEAPQVNAGTDLTIALNGTATLNATVTDDGLPQGSSLSYAWSMDSGPGTVIFANAAVEDTTATFSAVGDYVLRLTADDGDLSSSDTVNVTVTNVANVAPQVNAGTDLTIALNGTATLNATVTDDGLPQGSSLSYTWSMDSGPGTVTFANAAAEDTTATFSAEGDYVLRLTADDGDLSASDTVNITVINVANVAPQVNVGTDLTIALNDTATLNATVTDDGLPQGSSLSYAWSMDSGPGTVTFANASSEDTTATFSAEGDYVLRLTADDGDLSGSDTMNVAVNPISGLVSRPVNGGNCVAPDLPPSASQDIELVEPYPNLPTLTRPVAMVMAPGDDAYWYVIQQPGQVVRFSNNASVNSVSTFVDISDRVSGGTSGGDERGLFGMAFHPDFATNGYVYLSYYGITASNTYESRISRFQLTSGGQALDPASEVRLLTLSQPYGNHNGGHIAFGPDGYLYVGFGDGGSSGDPAGNGQNTNTLLGTMIRINVGDGSSGTYTIPPDNPFVSGGGMAEIYAWGFRNPWRWSFDKTTGDLWLGDVGQADYEEVDLVIKGRNYGWNTMEGFHCYSPSTGCDQTGLELPIVEYSHSTGISVTGGYVYRGLEITSLQGIYIYGDYGSGTIWKLEKGSNNQYSSAQLLSTGFFISSFAEANNGELYVLNLGGSVHKFQVASGGQGGIIFPLLSEWGCFQSGIPEGFSDSVVPYDINALLWSDDATKGRFMAIPDTATIDVDGEGRFVYPVGSILGKHFRLNGQLIETRLIMRHQDPHGWTGYSYEWNDTGTDAVLLADAKDKTIGSQVWHYPSRTECMLCHSSVAGVALGPELGQLNRDFSYPSPGTTANQLDTYEAIGLLGSALTPQQRATQFYAIDDISQSAELRARSYLHSNCANCHQPGGTGGGSIDMRMGTAFVDTGLCGASPLAGDLGITGALLIDPGNSANSILYHRMNSTGTARMPPLGTAIVDTQAVAVIQAWIDGLSGCP